MTDFDVFLMVDWSASSRPKKGADSIWYCLWTRHLGLRKINNPPTRLKAYEEIREILVTNVKNGTRTLVGFDFPYGYPTGFAKMAGLKSHRPWEAVWDLLDQLVLDDGRNRNRRGEVAARLNHLMSNDSFPFWGNGLKQELPCLCKTKAHCSSDHHASFGLKERRIVEERCPAQPAFKLAGAGSVGGQALLGIPYLRRLRHDPELSEVSCVWPFETGLSGPGHWRKQNSMIIHAEIYPSLVKVNPESDEVRDSAQVRTLASYFADSDRRGALPGLFAGPSDLTDRQRTIVENEEGWILGVLS